MEIILVSACLLGYNTKYNGGNNYNPLIEKIREKYDIIPICPEQLGGLKTPRVPSEIKGDEVYSKENKNVTSNFLEGSRKVANIALYNRIKKAILQENSPSCGVHNVYDGNFDNGIFVEDDVPADAIDDVYIYDANNKSYVGEIRERIAKRNIFRKIVDFFIK